MTLACTNAAAVTETIQRLYGPDHGRAMRDRGGVIHVTAVWQAAPDRHVTLRINEDTPHSPHDWFVLNLARARADAIITSGKILREEPHLSHELAGPSAAGLAAWRRSTLGKSTPPIVLILTGGRGFPLDHPALGGPATPIIYTGEDAAGALRAASTDNIRIVGAAAPTIRTAIAWLRDHHGCPTIAIETGATTANALYDPPLAIDELMLSVFHGPTIPPSVHGPEFVAPGRVSAALPEISPGCEVAEPSGRWRFYRRARASE